ncbi:orotidine-5'-phosphate decarboxylase [Candidatus Pacearchaeota archaeon]|nr:orotidine-5'-phosphate decarboxylase [Candidatus Pacearchaeota archaeon]
MKLTPKEEQAREMVCLPLDGLASMGDVEVRVKELSPVVGLFKIGMETYTRLGPEAVKIVQDYGADVFLDLKCYDIPNTVRGAAGAASQLGVYMLNVHASGGLEMMRAAFKGAREGAEKYGTKVPKIIAVTVLTSIDDKILNEELGVPGKVEGHVLKLAKLANQAGLDGIVCSAVDLSAIRNELPKDFMYVTPGIEGPRTSAGADQKRVLTPGYAVKNGSKMLVVGRAITEAGNVYKVQEGTKLLVMEGTPEERIQAGYEVLKDMANYL